jgi:hypothetical protein
LLELKKSLLIYGRNLYIIIRKVNNNEKENKDNHA